jgi:hypothetical protein
MSVRSRTGVLGKGTPRVPPTSEGPGGVLPAGNAEGNVLQWDADAGEWIAVAAPTVLGQRLYWDTATEQWVARDGSGFSQCWGSLNYNVLAVGFLYAGNYESAGVASSQVSNIASAGALLLTRLAFYGATAAPPSSCTFTIFVNGVSSGVSVVSAVAGPVEAVISLAVAALSTLAVQWSLAGASDSATRRPRITVRGMSND